MKISYTADIYRKKSVICVCMLFACLLWGSAYSGIKKGYELFGIDDIPSMFMYIGMRFTLAGAILAAVQSLAKRKPVLPEKNEIMPIALVGLIQTSLHYLLFYMALSMTSAVRSAMISGLKVFLNILVSALVFRMERFTARKAFTSLFAFVAVLINNFSADLSFSVNYGELIMIASIFVASAGTCMQKKWTERINPVKMCAYQFVFGGSFLLMAGWLSGGYMRFESVLCLPLIVYLAIVSSCGYGIQTTLLKYNDVSQVIVYRATEPFFGTVISAFVMSEFDELLNAKTIVSLVMIIAAILIVSLENGANS